MQLEWSNVNVDLKPIDFKSNSVCLEAKSPSFKNMNKTRFKIKAFASVLK